MTINKRFLRVKQFIANTLPYLGAAIIIFVYLGTAAFMTHLLAIRMGGMYWLAGTVGFGVSFTRMFIVFQSQMGIEQVAKRYDPGAIMAVFLTAYTILECWILEPDIAVSVTGLILSGLIVEVIYLSRLNQSSRHEVFSSPQRMKELKTVYQNERKFFEMVEQLEDERLNLSTGNEPPPYPSQNGRHRDPQELNLS